MRRLACLAILAAPATALAQPPDRGFVAEGLTIGRRRRRARRDAGLAGGPARLGHRRRAALHHQRRRAGRGGGRSSSPTSGSPAPGVRYTAARRVELFGSLDALAKQPAYSDAGPLQRASLGLKLAVSPKWALATATSGGPTIADDGLWGSAATAMVFRAHPRRDAVVPGERRRRRDRAPLRRRARPVARRGHPSAAR
jgi:hypothetical protein